MVRSVSIALWGLALAVSASAAPVRQLVDLPDENPLPKVHVLYAVPADGVDRQLDTNSTISTAILSLKQWIGDQTGRQPRFDYSVGELDVSFLRLTATSAAIRYASTAQALQIFVDELTAAGFTQPSKTYAIYYDGAGPSCGAATPRGVVAVAFLASCSQVVQQWDLVLLHELIHALGGVDPQAPHGTSTFHVSDDPQDLMAATAIVPNPHLDLDHQDYVGHTFAGQFDIMSSPVFENTGRFDPATCTAVVVDATDAAPVPGGDFPTFIVAPRACPWVLTPPPSWIAVDSGMGFGTSLVTLHVARNAQPTPRQVTLTLNGLIAANALTVSQPAGPAIRANIDTPADNATVRGAFLLAGWLYDATSPSGAGIGTIHLWAFPDSGAAPTFLGVATLGIGRPDVAAYFQAPPAATSGFGLAGIRLPVSGGYRITVYPFDTASQQFEFGSTVSVHVTVAPPASDPLLFVDVPAAGSTFISPYAIVAGWAADRDAPSSCGVDVVHIWAYPIVGGVLQVNAPRFVAAAPVNVPRPDVATYLGNPSAAACGFGVIGLAPAGTYQFVVYAHSTITGTFNNAKVVAPVAVK